MTNKNMPEVRFPGFTEEWEQRKLGDMMDVTSVKRIHQSDWTNSGIRFLRARDIVSAAKNEEPSDYLYISEEKYNEYSKISGKVSQGDLLVTGVGSIGVPLLITDDNPIYFKDGNIIWFKNEHKIDGNFFYYSFINNKIQKYIRDVAGIGTVGTYTIDSGKKTPISLPTYDEQIKIGSFFKQLDDTIALHQRELELLKETKKGFLQKMFPKEGEKVPEIRFPGFTEEWEQRKLGDIFKKDIQKNKDLEFHSDSVISVAKMKLSPPSTKSSDEYMKTYNKIWKGNIAFEGHTNDEFPNGRFVLNDCQDGIVSHIYDVYSAVDKYDNEFMKRYINNPYVMRKILINATSSARMMKSLNSLEFLKQSILLPVLSEQHKIGGFFYQLDNTIALHQRELDLLKETKKGFLQKLFV
ncbi:restriction endonuclease subunit S [Enterococcus gallinarum]|uniref:restriction endonuclease subunit S n=1 Tax=Enterococcus gallinarum TaxID=1353 RepID=UPI0009BE6430|nr:restriction endonuclease subunit S [Enterococcus gallinarum]OQO78176.1 restriction endonuclease subunit S [Enterococcus gallinarum]